MKKKKIKKIKKTKIKKIKVKKKRTVPTSENNKSKQVITKTEQQEEKVQITKIKKQAIEKRLYNIKDYVVYPTHGVGKILSIEKANIGQIEIQFYKISVDRDKLILSVPLNQQSKLRPIASTSQVSKCMTILKGKPKIKRSMWSRRAQEYDQKINSGNIYELTEVVRDLNKNTDIIADQSYSERQLFEKAYDRLQAELEVSLGQTQEEIKKKMNKSLGRIETQEE